MNLLYTHSLMGSNSPFGIYILSIYFGNYASLFTMGKRDNDYWFINQVPIIARLFIHKLESYTYVWLNFLLRLCHYGLNMKKNPKIYFNWG